MIYAIEGGDACGKATQAKILAERLNATLFSFPDYATPAGKAILGHLKGSWLAADLRRKTRAGIGYCEAHWPCTHDSLVLQSLMLTNRMERGTELREAAARGHVVLDRYDASTQVYGELDGLDPAWIRATNAQLPVRPDVYVLLDVPVEEGFRRRPERRDRYEADRGYLERVREGYLRLFTERQQERVEALGSHDCWKLPGPVWRVLDGLGSIDKVSVRVWAAVEPMVGGGR